MLTKITERSEVNGITVSNEARAMTDIPKPKFPTGIPCPVIAVIDGTVGTPQQQARAVASVLAQTRKPDLTFFVFDDRSPPAKTFCEENGSFLFLANARTPGSQGALNTGIMQAVSRFGQDCWVATLDMCTEWQDDHLDQCFGAVTQSQGHCRWVMTGVSASSGQTVTPPILPDVSTFFATNSPVRTSSLFVHASALLAAGCFDEALASRADSDLCIRLCDVLALHPRAYVTTGKVTVTDVVPTSRPGEHPPVPASTGDDVSEGLRVFLYKHGPRMSAAQQAPYLQRDAGRVSCHVMPISSQSARVPLQMWNGASVMVRRDTEATLKRGNPSLGQLVRPTVNKQRLKMLLGVITGSLERLRGLLADWSCMQGEGDFLLVFANSSDDEFVSDVSAALSQRDINGLVFGGTHEFVTRNFPDLSATNFPVPIAVSRTVLQNRLLCLTKRQPFDAVIVLDDDMRIPKGWHLSESEGDILLGRAIKTPPNPTGMSMRTQLLDFVHALDCHHATCPAPRAPSVLEDLSDQVCCDRCHWSMDCAGCETECVWYILPFNTLISVPYQSFLRGTRAGFVNTHTDTHTHDSN